MNKVLLKGRGERLIINLDKEAPLDELKDALKERILDSKNFLQSGKLVIEFNGRELSNNEEDELLSIIINEGVEVAYCISDDAKDKNSPIPIQLIKECITDRGMTTFHKGGLRSGHSIDVEGSVVVLGDVNPGANIKASGNIIVLGYLNGTAHAGGELEESAFIVAFKMNPIQLKIAHNIARSPSKDILANNRVNKNGNLEIAYIKEGQMLVEDLSKSSLENLVRL